MKSDESSSNGRIRLKTVRSAVSMFAMEAAIIVPFLTWATMQATAAETEAPWLSEIAAALQVMGFDRIPMSVVVPLALSAIAFLLWVQLEIMIKRARAGRIREELANPGIHFAMTALWAWTAAMLFQRYDIHIVLTIVANTIQIAALIGILWRVAIWKTRDNDPTSSLYGRFRHALPQRSRQRPEGGPP